MKWRKLGLIYRPDGSRSWGQTHAANPTAEHVDGDLWRIYFSCRDHENRSAISWVELDLRQPTRVLKEFERPRPAAGRRRIF